MTFMGLTLRGSEGSSRWLLLSSLALNLFFIGIGGALLMQSYGSDAPAPPTASDRSVAGRIARIAATLPREDADRLQAAYQARRDEIDGTRAAYRERQDAVRAALRAQPFDVEALKATMTEMRAARQIFDRLIHDFFAQQASEMSPTGRQKLADRPSSRRETETGQQSRN
ncbi:MAG: periplasmic heavy metal sensor [Rhizobiales bacterium]|nr:periplasmic heavy metal sensor [Hyphomicrobiales bacterium]